MNNIKLFPYKISSDSAKSIADFLGIKRLLTNGRYKYKKDDIIINWGNSVKPNFLLGVDNYIIINDFEAVENCINKLNCLTILKENNIPIISFMTSKEEAETTINKGEIIYCRTLLNSKSGKGIVIADTIEKIVDSKLYTSYFKNTNEYRVHVFNGEIIDLQEKRKMSEEKLLFHNISKEKRNRKIRNHDSGWCFCRNNIVFPEIISTLAIEAIKALGLTFGACDILYNEKTGKVAILEINTAPGLEAGLETHKNYCIAFSKYLDLPFSEENYNEFYKK